jgi:drug/metabolite transporter (DMT)-like permease
VRWNLAVAVLAASWGFVAIIVRQVDLDAGVLVFYRTLFAVVALALVLAVARGFRRARLEGKRLWALFLGTTLGLHWFLFFVTIKLSSVAFALLVAYTAPILVALFGPLVLPEPRSRAAVAALFVAGPGLVLVALGGGKAEVTPLAVLTGLGTAATYALLVIGTKRIAAEVSAAGLTLWNYAIAGLVMAPVVVFADRARPEAGELPYLVLLGVVFTALSGYLYIWLIRRVTAQAMGVLAYLEPISAALLAWAILGEELGWAEAVGGALVVAAGVAVVLYEPPDVEAPAPPG